MNAPGRDEREVIAHQVVVDRNAADCPRREALLGTLSRAMGAMHGYADGEDGRYQQLRFWWEMLMLTDCEIDSETEKEVRELPMRKGQALPKDQLAATDLEESRLYPVTIARHPATMGTKPDSVAMKRVREGGSGETKSKPHLAMKNRRKYLIVASTTWDQIVAVTGEEDSAKWIGKEIVLARVNLKQLGEKHLPAHPYGIRILAPGAVMPQDEPQEPHEDEVEQPPFQASDSDVPF